MNGYITVNRLAAYSQNCLDGLDEKLYIWTTKSRTKAFLALGVISFDLILSIISALHDVGIWKPAGTPTSFLYEELVSDKTSLLGGDDKD
jgi:hypothetical protein